MIKKIVIISVALACGFVTLSFNPKDAYANSDCFSEDFGGEIRLVIDRSGKTLPSNGDQITASVTLTNGCAYATGDGEEVLGKSDYLDQKRWSCDILLTRCAPILLRQF